MAHLIGPRVTLKTVRERLRRGWPSLQRCLPHALRPHVIAILPWKVAYLRVPKVANTSVKHALAKGLALPRLPGLSVTNDAYWRKVRPEEVKLIPLTQLRFDPRFADFWSFCVVRHPVDRLVSCYRNKIVRNSSLSGPFARLGFDQNMSFEEFAHRACDISDLQADVHFVSQAALVSWSGKPMGDLVLPLVGLNARWSEVQQEIKRRTGVVLPGLSVKNSTKKVKQDIELTPELVALIEKRYACDLELFNLSLRRSLI